MKTRPNLFLFTFIILLRINSFYIIHFFTWFIYLFQVLCLFFAFIFSFFPAFPFNVFSHVVFISAFHFLPHIVACIPNVSVAEFNSHGPASLHGCMQILYHISREILSQDYYYSHHHNHHLGSTVSLVVHSLFDVLIPSLGNFTTSFLPTFKPLASSVRHACSSYSNAAGQRDTKSVTCHIRHIEAVCMYCIPYIFFSFLLLPLS